MSHFTLEETATAENFNEEAYLRANPDVAAAVRDGWMPSGRHHFTHHGLNEGRKLQCDSAQIENARRSKLNRIRPLLRDDMLFIERGGVLDFLMDELRDEFGIVHTDNVSALPYYAEIEEMILKYPDGILLDCGAGNRPVYYSNVLNYEIKSYPSTDIMGVNEQLPFKDGSFDAVISVAVLEHVKDPFQCAREISRVLKPGGELLCSVPFLQPYHSFPHHYYNMTHQGLRNLFDKQLIVERVVMMERTLPIHTLTWILNSWAEGLSGVARDEFLNLRVSDLMGEAPTYFKRGFVRELSAEKNIELASAFTLFARKSSGTSSPPSN